MKAGVGFVRSFSADNMISFSDPACLTGGRTQRVNFHPDESRPPPPGSINANVFVSKTPCGHSNPPCVVLIPPDQRSKREYSAADVGNKVF